MGAQDMFRLRLQTQLLVQFFEASPVNSRP
jgi:hypothetical protein